MILDLLNPNMCSLILLIDPLAIILFTAVPQPLLLLLLILFLAPTPFFSQEDREFELEFLPSSERCSKIEKAETKIPDNNEEALVDDDDDLWSEELEQMCLNLGEIVEEVAPDDEFSVPALSNKFFIT